MAQEQKEDLHKLLQGIDNAEIFERLVSSPNCGETVRGHLRTCRECSVWRGKLLQKKVEALPPEKRERLTELGNQLVAKLAGE